MRGVKIYWIPEGGVRILNPIYEMWKNYLNIYRSQYMRICGNILPEYIQEPIYEGRWEYIA